MSETQSLSGKIPGESVKPLYPDQARNFTGKGFFLRLNGKTV
jgi:hypothetical protein